MSMSLNNIKPELNPYNDTYMSDDQQSKPQTMIAEDFDDPQADFSHFKTLSHLFKIVLEKEFKDISVGDFRKCVGIFYG